MKATAVHFLVLTVAGWLQRRREEQIAYLLAENAIYKEHFTKRRLRLTDAQRRRIAVKGKAGKRVLEIGCGMGFHTETMIRAGAKSRVKRLPGSVHGTSSLVPQQRSRSTRRNR